MRVRVVDARRPRWTALSLALALGLPALGCHKKESTATPSADTGGAAKTSEYADDPVAELAALEGRMAALGLPTASSKREQGEGEKGGEVDAADAATEEVRAEEHQTSPVPSGAQVQPSPPAERDDSLNVCADLCSLSESICSLEVRICSLAEAHENDATYTDACERAVEDCEVAGEACETCG